MAETVKWDAFNPAAMIRALRDHPAEVATLRFPRMEAGALVRRHVRAALNEARIRGAEVESREERGLLDSVFAVRMVGTPEQLVPTLLAFAAMED